MTGLVADLLPRMYGAHVYQDSQGRTWLTESTVPEQFRPLEDDELVNIGGILYIVILYAPGRREFLLQPFWAEITGEDWPLLEEEPDAPARPDPEL